MGIVCVREWLPQFLWCLAILALLVLSAVASGAGGDTTGDRDWIADSIRETGLLIGILISSGISIWGLVKASKSEKNSAASDKNSAVAVKDAAETKAITIKTAEAVNGKMTEMTEMAEELATIKAVLAERDRQATEDNAVDAAVAIEEKRARDLKATAAAADPAASTQLPKPVPVEVVTGDTPLEVVEKGKGTPKK